jgi:hypothetical protein
MERKKPGVDGGRLALESVLVGRLNPKTKRMVLSAPILAQIKAAASAASGGEQPKRKLVKVDDQFVWQTFRKTADGKVIAEVEPATQEELQQYQQQMQAQQAQQAQQSKLQNRQDWQQKLGTVQQNLGIFGSSGQLIMGLAGGPNPYTGRAGAGWLSGWILAQRLNGKAEGKLLPQWLQTGWVSTALDWGIQAYGMLDIGNDVRTIRDFITKAPATPLSNPDAMAHLIAKGMDPARAAALAQTGELLRVGEAALRQGRLDGLPLVSQTGDVAIRNMTLEGASKGAAQLITKEQLQQAYAATDPVKDAGLAARASVDSGVVKGLGVLKGLVQPAMIGATALGLISSSISVKNLVDKNGAKVLIDTKQGRGALLGALSSAAFLGMYLAPMVLPGLGVTGAALAAASSAVNITSNVVGGVQLLNTHGLFGEDGFLNHDAVRAAFLIPPLTPIGAFAFVMKRRKAKADEEAKKLAAAQQVAIQQVAQQREMAKLQLQSRGNVSGAKVGQDGSIVVATSVPNDLTQLAKSLPPHAAAASK